MVLLLPNAVAVAKASVEVATVEPVAYCAAAAAVDVQASDAADVVDAAMIFEVMVAVVQCKFLYELMD